MTLAALNQLPRDQAVQALLSCCSSRSWAEAVLARAPFPDADALDAAAADAWWLLPPVEWLIAFAAHPRIGAHKAAQPQAGRGDAWSSEEQAGVTPAEPSTRDRLRELNQIYEQRFGHIFLVCATGKPAVELLTLLEQRMAHDPETELRIAAEEQVKITRLRLRRLIEDTL